MAATLAKSRNAPSGLRFPTRSTRARQPAQPARPQRVCRRHRVARPGSVKQSTSWSCVQVKHLDHIYGHRIIAKGYGLSTLRYPTRSTSMLHWVAQHPALSSSACLSALPHRGLARSSTEPACHPEDVPWRGDHAVFGAVIYPGVLSSVSSRTLHADSQTVVANTYLADDRPAADRDDMTQYCGTAPRTHPSVAAASRAHSAPHMGIVSYMQQLFLLRHDARYLDSAYLSFLVSAGVPWYVMTRPW